MKTITKQDINSIISKLKQEKNPLLYLYNRMEENDPTLFKYIVGVNDEEFNADERNLLMYSSATVWYIIIKTEYANKKIKVPDIEKQLMLNYDHFGHEGGVPMNMIIENICKGHSQEVLMSFLTRMIFNVSDQYRGEIRDEMLFIVFLCTMAMVDCMIVE